MQKFFKKLLFPIVGLISLVWFLVRVIPKPIRATYPCMRVAAPIASSFMIYLIGLTSSLFFLKKARRYFQETKYVFFLITLFLGLSIGLFTSVHSNKKAYATTKSAMEGPNQPIGTGKGIYPGRVVWIYNPDATNENYVTTTNTDFWYADDNTDQTVVTNMLSQGLQMMTGQATDAAAWDAIFHYYNQNHGKGDVGYTAGEKVVIKINLNGLAGSFPVGRNTNTSPQIAYAVLNQLVNVVGVAQADISIGDPSHNMDDPTYNKCHGTFANVKYWGRGTSVVKSANYVLFSSDGTVSDWLPQAYLDAAYMINIPVFKKHHRAGISLTSKNHFGSIAPFNNGAWHWHYSLPFPDPTLGAEGWQHPNPDYGVYRCFVDYMGHKDLGGKTILFLIDGLWGSINWGHPPIKWRMTPFNNDWPSSLFLSQDPVAIESVGFDFLYYEFDENHPTEGTLNPTDDTHGPFPHFSGTEDFLIQAADSLNWAAGIIYDPEKDGIPLPRSLGAHERWNNAVDKQYTRNLGGNTGIELVSNYTADAIIENGKDLRQVAGDFTLYPNYPNPFNASTTIHYNLSIPSRVNISLYTATGQKIKTIVDEQEDAGYHAQRWDGMTASGLAAASGIYFYKITVHNSKHTSEQVQKMILNK
jgi:hypothetical protein